MHLILLRDLSTDLSRTFGVLTTDGLLLQTLELPWVPADDGSPCGHQDTSCLPAGRYSMALHNSAAHPRTWALVNPALGVYHLPTDIPAGIIARAVCLLHSANIIEQLRGCVAVGESRSYLNGEPDVAQSVIAMGQLQAAVPWIEGHTLDIIWGGQHGL